MNKENWFKNVMWAATITLIAFWIGVAMYYFFFEKDRKNEHVEQYHVTVHDTDTAIIHLDIWQTIQDVRLEHPALCYKHAKWECAHFTDILFIRYNNCFGMQYARKRPTTQSGYVTINGTKWGVYRHWRDSVYDYLIWQILYARGLSEEQYKNKLFQVYGAKNIKW